MPPLQQNAVGRACTASARSKLNAVVARVNHAELQPIRQLYHCLQPSLTSAAERVQRTTYLEWDWGSRGKQV